MKWITWSGEKRRQREAAKQNRSIDAAAGRVSAHVRTMLAVAALWSLLAIDGPRAHGVVLLQFEPGGPLHAYRRDPAEREWNDARLLAGAGSYRGAAGHLITIANLAEQRWAEQLAGPNNTWIGLTDHESFGGAEFGNQEVAPRPTVPQLAPAGPGQRGQGWVWITGEPATFQSWSSFEPNSDGDEDAAHLRSDGPWSDDRAGAALGQGGAAHAALIEYDVNLSAATVDAFKVKFHKHYNGVTNLAIADDVVAGIYPSTVTTAQLPVLNLRDSGSDANAPGGLPVPGLTQDAGNDHFVSVNTATLNVASDGIYTFFFNSDDGGRLRIDGLTVADFFGSRGPHNTIAAPIHLSPGQHALEFLWFENTGGAGAEVGYAPGAKGELDFDFRLLGDSSQGIALAGPIQSTTYQVTLFPDFGLDSGQGLTPYEAAQRMLDGTLPTTQFEYFADVLNMNEKGTTSFFGNDDPFLGMNATNRERYALEATALLEILEGGVYTFGTRSDGGAVLTIDGATVIFDASLPGRNAFGSVMLNPGLHPVQLVMWADGPQSEIELFAALGQFTSFNAQAFRLVGDIDNGGLRVTQAAPRSVQVIPEPMTALTWTILVTVLGGRRRPSRR